jgi:hypothetical protein
MFDRSWIGYPCPSLFEYLVVFAVLFLSGNLWAIGTCWYLNSKSGETCHA